MVKITNQVITLIQDGESFSSVARILNCSRNTVKSKFWEYVDNHPLAVPSNLWGIPTKDVIRIVQRKNDGDRVEDIARDFEISKSYVYKLIKGYINASR
jgi:DNA-binding CsgD family transcriptional regulator